MKKIIKTLLIVVGLVLIADAVFLSMVGNFTLGIVAAFLLGVIFAGYGAFSGKINKAVPKWIRYTVVAGICCVILMVSFLGVYGNVNTADYTEEAVIVLGAGIKGDRPSLPLVRRLDKTVEYYEKNKNAIIVVSGGQGFQEEITEALAMERYLIDKGVPRESIIKEEKATSTYENYVFSKEILDKHFKNNYKIVFITNDFHVYRASRLAKLAGFDDASHISSITEWYTLPVNYLRECMAVVKLWIFKQ